MWENAKTDRALGLEWASENGGQTSTGQAAGLGTSPSAGLGGQPARPWAGRSRDGGPPSFLERPPRPGAAARVRDGPAGAGRGACGAAGRRSLGRPRESVSGRVAQAGRGLLCARGVPGARRGARLWPAGGGGARAGGRGRGGGLAGDPVPAVLRAQLEELRRPGRGGRDFCALSLLPIMQTKRAHYGPLDDAERVRKVKVTAVRKCVLLEAS